MKHKILAYSIIVPLLVFSFNKKVRAQVADSASGVFFSIEEASIYPDNVIELHLVRKKLKEIPGLVFTFTNLKVLDLHNNKITNIGPRISELSKLEELAVSKNKLSMLPDEIGELQHLRKLILNRNNITAFPSSAGNLQALEYLDLWDNYISVFPAEAASLSNLEELDMRGISMTKEEQEAIKEMLPDVEIQFSQYCNCKPHINNKNK